MDLRALRYFIAVVEAGSLSRAAHSLYVAQPALTAQIKKLEGELGAQLLERSHAGVTPTPAGSQLYEDARRLLSDADAMRERIKHVPQGPEGSVTVAVPFLLTTLLLGPVIARLRDQHPRVRVFVIDGLSLTVHKAMLDGRADLAILVDAPSPGDLVCTPLAEEAMYICGQDHDGRVAPLLQPQAGSSLPAMAFADAAGLPLVLQPRRYAIRQAVEAAAEAQGLRLNIVHEHDSARVIRSLYQCGAGFTFTPACSLTDVPPWLWPQLADAEPQARQRQGSGPGRWLVAQVVAPVLRRQYTLAVQARRAQDAATQAVAQALADHAQDLMRQGIWRATPL
ncbi:LysR family transcriptional regulator [Comamonas serinivorans]|uniref:LysR family transcriptional regulator n=1 Tax=Comamonas serinivorans TaxID=1082851 RepID=A0A1Y0EMN3_9BURK|nr:LysR family transcriptional regulator [Comamonas serinivorans]ARU04680.1 LysR family transcriptional regulator [Comamonas serinivorans]